MEEYSIQKIRFPKNDLNTLCDRFNIDRTIRKYAHGAKIDVELLNNVYDKLIVVVDCILKNFVLRLLKNLVFFLSLLGGIQHKIVRKLSNVNGQTTIVFS